MDDSFFIDSFVINGREIAWQVFQSGNKQGTTALVTAGMDGDELTGIAIAQKLITEWRIVDPAISVVIIPIINVLGNVSGVSWNPQDGRYPKRSVPNGEKCPSNYLIRRLFDRYVSHAIVWIDLHGGSRSEVLQPFLWLHEQQNCQEVSLPLRSSYALPIPIVATASDWPIAAYAMSHYDTRYMVLEAGCGSVVRDEDVLLGTKLVQSIIQGVATHTHKTFPIAKRHVFYAMCKTAGVWNTQICVGDLVKRGMEIGNISLQGVSVEVVRANATGEVLYFTRSGEHVDRNHEVVIIGTD